MTARLPQTVRVAKLCASLPPEKFDEVVRIVRDLEDELWAIRRGRNLILELQNESDEDPRPLGTLDGAPWPNLDLEIVERRGDPGAPVVEQIDLGGPVMDGGAEADD